MSDAIKRSLRAELDRQSARPERDLGAVIKRGTRKRAMKWMATGMTTAIVIAGAGLLWRDLAGSPVRFGPSQGEHQKDDPLGNGCPRSKGKVAGQRWTSPTVHVATGTNDGNDWVMCARTVERTTGKDRGAEGLCINWLYGDGPDSGMGCVFSHDADGPVALDSSYFFETSGPEWGYFYGAVPAAGRSVEFVDSTDARLLGNVHPAPDELGVPFRFFTLFAEPFTEGTLIVRDDDGDVIRERVMEHGLSQLVVTKDGDGEGTVTGFHSALLTLYERCQAEGGERCGREPRPVWIECGDDCDAALADAEITLIAEPTEGSRFVGWSGACSGTGECELVVDENLSVTATFEPSP